MFISNICRHCWTIKALHTFVPIILQLCSGRAVHPVRSGWIMAPPRVLGTAHALMLVTYANINSCPTPPPPPPLSLFHPTILHWGIIHNHSCFIVSQTFEDCVKVMAAVELTFNFLFIVTCAMYIVQARIL